MLGSRQIQIFTQDFEQRLVRREGDFGLLAVQCETDVLFTVVAATVFLSSTLFKIVLSISRVLPT